MLSCIRSLPLAALILLSQSPSPARSDEVFLQRGPSSAPSSERVEMDMQVEGFLLLGEPPLTAAAKAQADARGSAEELGNQSSLEKSQSGNAQRMQELLESTEIALGKVTGKAPLKLTAKIAFDGRPLSEPGKYVRQYSEANAEVFVRGKAEKKDLRSTRRNVVVQLRETGLDLDGLEGPLTSDEADLLHTASDPALFSQLLPANATPLNGEWSVEPGTAAALCGLEAATSATIRGKFLAVKGPYAEFEVQGSCEGAIGGVASQIEVRLRGASELKSGQVVGISLALKEKRAIGIATPGIEAITKLVMKRKPLATAEILGELCEISESFQVLDDPIREAMVADKQIHFLHDRRCTWLHQSPEQLTFRLVDANTLLAHANLVLAPQMTSPKPLSLEEFQADIRQSLANKQTQIVSAKTGTTSKGIHYLQTTVGGESEGVAFEWRFYHLMQPDGRRASLTFVAPAEHVERLGAADMELVESLSFHDIQTSPEEQVQANSMEPISDPAAASPSVTPDAAKNGGKTATAPTPLVK